MKKSASKTLLLFFFASPAMAQQRSGVVVDFATKEAIANVTIVNRKKAEHSTSNNRGTFNITASVFDTLLFLSTNYQPFKTTVHPHTPKNLDTIFLKRKVNSLKEVTVLSDYLKLQKDSVETYKLYHKSIADAKRKAKAYIDTPIFRFKVDGFLSEPIEILSGRKKRKKAFFAMIRQDYEEKFIALYFNPEKVKSITQINDSLAQLFCKEYPMPYDYARSATPLEKDIWIKEKFTEFQKKQFR